MQLDFLKRILLRCRKALKHLKSLEVEVYSCLQDQILTSASFVWMHSIFAQVFCANLDINTQVQDNMHIIDIIIVITYLALCILIALYKSKSIRTLKEYTLGRGYFSNIVIITTIFATDIGAVNFMGSIEKVYTFGTFFVVIYLLSPLFWVMMAKVYGENIDQFRGCMSLSDIMDLLYGKIARWSTNVVLIIISIGVVAIQAKAMGYLVKYFFGISYSCSVIISILILAIYSAFGGIRAVALTDAFQLAVIMIAIPIAFSFVYHDVGGYNGIVNSLQEDFLHINLNQENIFLFSSLVLYALLPNISGVYTQRFLMCRDSIQLTYCLNVIAVISCFFAITICLIGLILKIKEPDMPSDIVFIHFVANHVAIGFKGLIIAGLLAIIMSTADSWLNNASVLVTHDIIRKIRPLTESKALLVAKVSTFFISTLAIFLAMNKKGLMEINWLLSNFFESIILVPLTAGFFQFKTNSKSFISSIILAIFSTAIGGYIMKDFGTISLMCGIAGSAIGLFGMHCWQIHRRFL